MRTIAFYISDYGYGHATRSIALMREMLRQDENIRFIVCNSFALSFLQQSLQGENRVLYHDVQTDVGYVLQENSLQLDQEQLEARCEAYVMDLPQSVGREVEFLKPFAVDAVMSDISPMAFEVAERLGVPSIGISNFTWYTAYQGVVSEKVLRAFEEMYSKATYFYSLAASQERSWGREDHGSFGFYSRVSDWREVQRIRDELNPDGTKYIIFMPLGMKIDMGDLSHLPLWNQENCVFVVSSSMNVHHRNVVKIPADYTESQHYVAAADLIISKAGWGIASEAAGNGKPLLVIDRKDMNEDQHTIQYLVERNMAEVMTWEEVMTLDVSEYKEMFRKQAMVENEVREAASRVWHALSIQV